MSSLEKEHPINNEEYSRLCDIADIYSESQSELQFIYGETGRNFNLIHNYCQIAQKYKVPAIVAYRDYEKFIKLENYSRGLE